MDGWRTCGGGWWRVVEGSVAVEGYARCGDLRPAFTPANPAQAGTILIGWRGGKKRWVEVAKNAACRLIYDLAVCVLGCSHKLLPPKAESSVRFRARAPVRRVESRLQRSADALPSRQGRPCPTLVHSLAGPPFALHLICSHPSHPQPE